MFKNWFIKTSSKENNKVKSIKDFNLRMKNIIRQDPYILKMFEDANIDIREIDNGLTFSIKDLGDKHAEANSKNIIFDKKLFDNDFEKENMHFLIHELNHWLNRKAEKKWYFNDLEEIKSFVLAMGWEISKGSDYNKIFDKMFPVLIGHFNDKDTAKSFFKCLYSKALKYNNK